MSETRREPRRVLLGLARLARFRESGFAQFGDTPQDFLNSLAPLAGFALVGAGLRLASGEPAGAALDLLLAIVALLGPPVLSHALARFWGREPQWRRYATAFNWCIWPLLLVFAVSLVLIGGTMTAAGARPEAAVMAAEGCWTLYGLGLHWFLARRGLGLGVLRALLLVILVECGTGVLVLGPLLLAGRMLPDGPVG